MNTANKNLECIDATDGDVKEDSFIAMANERVTEVDGNPGSIISLYAAALRDAERSLESQIGECDWETEVAPLLVKGIKSFFRQRNKRSHHPAEIEQQDDYGDADATENERNIKAQDRAYKARIRKNQLNNQRRKEKESKKCGRPPKGQEKEKDGNYIGRR